MNHEQAAEDGYHMKEGRKKGAAAGTAGIIQKAAEHREQIVTAARRAWIENKGLSVSTPRQHGHSMPTPRNSSAVMPLPCRSSA
jgi:hypothetical protein